MGNRAYVAIGITFIVTPVFYVWLIYTFPAISSYPWLHAAALAIDLVIFIAIVVIFTRHFLLPRSPYKTFAGFCMLAFFHLRHDHIVREHLPIFWMGGWQRGRYEYP